MDYQTASIGLVIIGGLFALYKWIVSRKDKSRAEQNKTQDEKLAEHKERLERHRELLDKLAEAITATKDELHKDYVKVERFLQLDKKMDAALKELFNRQSAMARDLNQSIGEMKATKDSEIKSLITGVENAIKHAKQPSE